MAVKTSWAAGDVLTAADLTDTFAAKAPVSTTGQVLITTANATSGAGSMSVNNCFSATYDHYRIVLKGSGSSASTVALLFRFRNAGTDKTGANYTDNTMYSDSSAGPSRVYQAAQTSGVIAAISDKIMGFEIVVYNPYNATGKTYHSIGSTWGGTNTQMGVRAGYYGPSDVCDGFTLSVASGTITALSASVYGLKA